MCQRVLYDFHVKDNYEKLILTRDRVFTDFDDNGIKIINVIDWCLK